MQLTMITEEMQRHAAIVTLHAGNEAPEIGNFLKVYLLIGAIGRAGHRVILRPFPQGRQKLRLQTQAGIRRVLGRRPVCGKAEEAFRTS